MKQEEKELLMKDLCGRLPYQVKIKTNFFKTATLISLRKNISLNSGKDLSISYDISGKDEPFQIEERWGTPISEIKPYLIPLSSMSEEQKKESPLEPSLLDAFINGRISLFEDEELTVEDIIKIIDWFNKNHFDYRGLIEKELAIDATGFNIY